MYYKILIWIIIGAIIYYIFDNHYEFLSSHVIDQLDIPVNPDSLNAIELRNRGRVVTIEEIYKLNKYDTVEKVLYSIPKPEEGETKCVRTRCPKYLDRVLCYKCY